MKSIWDVIVLALIIGVPLVWFFSKIKPDRDYQGEELNELRSLYERASATGYPDETVTGRFVAAFFDALEYELSAPLKKALQALIAAERFTISKPNFAALDFVERIELKKQLKEWERKRDGAQDRLEEFLTVLFVDIAENLPRTETPTPFTIPMCYAFPQFDLWVSHLFKRTLDADFRTTGLLKSLRDQIYRNICTNSGYDPEKPPDDMNKLKWPHEVKLPPDELNDAFLRRTPFHELFASPVPLKLTYEDRFNHMHIVGGTGAGKTTLIENLIRHDLASDDPPSLVVIDPHSDLIKKLTSTELGLGDRLIVIDPRDTKYPPALNIFAINKERFSSYDEATQEQVTAGVIQTFNYMLGSLTSLSLTGKQDVFFRYVARLMLSMPDTMGRNATILDMLKLMHEPTEYEPAIAALPDIPREFFRKDFMSKTFETTKEQIRYRLQAIIENPTMARLFTCTETKIDLFTELNRGSVILVDTAKDFLKENSAIFGRLFISLVLQAVLERAAMEEQDRKPTFLIVDEAASYFDRNIDDLLTDTRKYKCGCVFGHQYLDQASSSLRASLHANTGIKFASGLSAADARTMATEMRTTAEFIMDQPKLQFATYIRNVTPQAVSVPIKPITDRALLSQTEIEGLMARNRKRIALPPSPHPVHGPEGENRFARDGEPDSPKAPEEDTNAGW